MVQSADQWNSIRPWIRRFALSVNQVSSVSATFTLKSALTAQALDPALESLLEDEEDEPPFPTTDRPASAAPGPRAVSDALTQGLSVKVNSSPWQRVLLRVDEESDEAIIIVFGLMPGRQYDVELGISHRHEALRSQITTDVSRQSFLRSSSHQGQPLNVRCPIQPPIRPIPIPLGTINTIRAELTSCLMSSCQPRTRLRTFRAPSLHLRALHRPPLPLPLPRCLHPLQRTPLPPRRPSQPPSKTGFSS